MNPEERAAFHHIKEGNIGHEAQEDHREGRRRNLLETRRDASAGDDLIESHGDVPAIQHRNGQQIDDGQVDVEHHEKAQGQADVGVHVSGQFSEDSHRSAHVLGDHACFLRVRQSADQFPHLAHHPRNLLPRGWAGSLQLVGQHPAWRDGHPDAGHAAGGVHARCHGECHALARALHLDLGGLAGLGSDEFHQLGLSHHRHAAERDKLVIHGQSCFLGGTARSQIHDDRMIFGVQVQQLEPEGGIDDGRQDIIGNRISPGDLHRNSLGPCQHRKALDVLPPTHNFTIDADHTIALSDAQSRLGGIGLDVADDRRIDRNG